MWLCIRVEYSVLREDFNCIHDIFFRYDISMIEFHQYRFL